MQGVTRALWESSLHPICNCTVYRSACILCRKSVREARRRHFSRVRETEKMPGRFGDHVGTASGQLRRPFGWRREASSPTPLPVFPACLRSLRLVQWLVGLTACTGSQKACYNVVSATRGLLEERHNWLAQQALYSAGGNANSC